MKLAYTRSGTPDAPAIVFLHGMAMGPWMWHDQIQHFADYDCYNVDLPGHGGSNQIAWESFDQAADCVAQLIAEDLPGKPVTLVGMSLGAVVGLHLLTRHGQMVECAVLTGPFAEPPPRWMMTVQSAILSLALSTRVGKQLFARTLHIPPDAMPYYNQSIDAFSMTAFRRITREIVNYMPLALDNVRVPTLLATGENDVGLNRRSVVQLAQRVPGAVGVFAPGSHHGWNGEDPDLFNAMTRAWIEGQPLPSRLLPAVA
jgi:pimeloyl-ACP methyl ester carboxylesterase